MITAPIIDGERVRLRPIQMSDFEQLRAFMASDRSCYVGGPMKSADCWRMFAADAGQWVLMGFGCWAIELRETGAYIGQVALNNPVGFPERELGWLLWDGYEGHGFAQEAALLARGFAFETLGWSTVVSYVDQDNQRSIKLAEQMGAVLDTDAATPNDEPCFVYRHNPAQFRKTASTM